MQFFLQVRRTLCHRNMSSADLIFKEPLAKRICKPIHVHGYYTKSGDACAPARRNVDTDEKYEDAVSMLQSLVSNAGQVSMTRKCQALVEAQVSKTKRYLERTGLTADDFNKLSVIHVSGTKGKGSTCAFSERILNCHGYKTGLFTSPHLFEVRERIRINGRPISKEKFHKYFWNIYNSLKETEVSSRADEGDGMPFFFCFLTIMSIHVFLKEGVDVAIMEVGIGGQYDTTNIFDRPVVCGVTALGMDHMSILGNTIEEIAWNKAGIFKIGRPAVTVAQQPNAMKVILDRAREIKSPLFVSQTKPREELNRYCVNLGIDCEKQAENASLAVQLTDFWMKLRASEQVPGTVPTDTSCIEDIPKLTVDNLKENTVKGLSTCVWHGRTQTINRDGLTYYIDGAHTQESMEVCTKWFKQKANEEKHGLRNKSVVRLLMFNSSGERNVNQFFSLLKECDFDIAIFCTNQFSTDASQNKPDSFYTGVKFEKLIEKITTNKNIWDAITSTRASSSSSVSSSSSSSSSLDLITSTSVSSNLSPPSNINSEVLADRHISGKDDYTVNTRIPTVDLDVNSNILQGPNANNNDSVFSEPKIINNLERRRSRDTAKEDDFSREIHKSCKRYEKNLREPDIIFTKTQPSVHHSLISSKEMPNESNHVLFRAQSESLNETQRTDQNGSISLTKADMPRNLSPKSVSPSQSKTGMVSVALPSILDALTWATQGRDPHLQISSCDSDLPEAPTHLVKAGHIQILITGSLHLVGGALEALTPHIND